MEGVGKALLTAGSVAVVLWLARRLSPRAAGIVAGLPLVTAPALGWIAHAGSAFAAGAAVAGVAAGAMLAAFAVAYAHAARRRGIAAAVVCGLAGACALAWPALAASHAWPAALGLSSACGALALCGFPVATGLDGRRGPARRPSYGVTALAAGLVSLLATFVAPLLGVFAAGMVASLPVVSASVAAAEQAAGGPGAVVQFLHGFVLGLFGRAVFGTVFALAAVPLGAGSALGLGCAAAAVVALLCARLCAGHASTAGPA